VNVLVSVDAMRLLDGPDTKRVSSGVPDVIFSLMYLVEGARVVRHNCE